MLCCTCANFHNTIIWFVSDHAMFELVWYFVRTKLLSMTIIFVSTTATSLTTTATVGSESCATDAWKLTLNGWNRWVGNQSPKPM